jgi:hypothetical protein
LKILARGGGNIFHLSSRVSKIRGKDFSKNNNDRNLIQITFDAGTFGQMATCQNCFIFRKFFLFHCPTPKLLVRANLNIKKDFVLKKSTNSVPVAQSMSELSVMTKK